VNRAAVGAQGRAPETYMWTRAQQMAVSLAATDERRTQAAFTSRRKQRNADADARTYVAALNAVSGANDETCRGSPSEAPGGGTTPRGRVRMREGVSLQKNRKSVRYFGAEHSPGTALRHASRNQRSGVPGSIPSMTRPHVSKLTLCT
jgi:hypothetical protein